MPAGAHITSWMGAAECSGIMAARFRITCANADSNAYANTKAHPNSSTRRRWLLPNLGFNANLYGRQSSELEWNQLHGKFLDAESESIHQ